MQSGRPPPLPTVCVAVVLELYCILFPGRLWAKKRVDFRGFLRGLARAGEDGCVDSVRRVVHVLRRLRGGCPEVVVEL